MYSFIIKCKKRNQNLSKTDLRQATECFVENDIGELNE